MTNESWVLEPDDNPQPEKSSLQSLDIFAGRSMVATVWGPGYAERGRLIAAAPDLLRTAKELLRKLEEWEEADNFSVPAERLPLEDAIAKAEGE